MIARVCIACTAAIAACCAPAGWVRAQPALVGAIRWDGWYGNRGPVGVVLEKTLAPAQFRYRLPFYARVDPDGSVSIDGSSQAVVDEEIQLASKAGLDYWAFVTYPAGDPLSLALDRYLASPYRKRIRFCLVTEAERWKDRSFRQRVEDLMCERGYLTVMNGRPVLFLGFLNETALAAQWGSVAAFRTALDAFRQNVRRRGLGNPYIVILDFQASSGAQWASRLGGQAISSYATEGGGEGAPYAALAAHAEHFWDDCLNTGCSVVPIVMTGWDRRPRVMHPHPWEPWQKPGVGMEKYYKQADPKEIADHLLRAVEWVRSHPATDPARLILIYAWNENDEGGWLVPTLSEGDARLKAIAPVLAEAHRPR